MSDVKCATMLIRAAERDFEALRFMRDSDEIPDEVFGFHVQQAAEKSLKAHLALLGETYPLTHNIEALLDMLAKRSIATASFRQLIGYTPFAVEFRYQGVGSDTEATFTAYENIIKLCIDEHVDALLIAGDVYDSGDRSLLGYFEVGRPSADCSYSALPRR